MQGFDLSSAQAIYVGDQVASAVYLGSTQIWTSSHDYSQDYLTIENIDDKTTYVTCNFIKRGTGTLQYSRDNGATWLTGPSETSGGIVFSDKILLKGNFVPKTNSWQWEINGCINFDIVSIDGNRVMVYGNPLSILYEDNFVGQSASGKNFAFNRLFYHNSSGTYASALVDASNLYLDFTLSQHCCDSMFENCTILTAPPALPQMTLYDFCYSNMFAGCTSLVNAPALPATTLVRQCYGPMFKNCTSLVNAPELPANTLQLYCYYEMFRGCTNLNYVKCLATDISASNCTNNWLTSVAASGTFIKDSSMSSWPTSSSGIPSGWAIVDATN